MFVRNKFSPDRSNIKFFHQLLERLPSIIKEYDPQIVFSSSPMTASHAAVSKVVQQAGIPWIAEFRDTFEQVYKSNFLRSLIGKREAKNLEQASAVIGVTPVMVERLKSRYKGEVHLIPNGFSPDQFPSPAPELDQKFSITYTGSMTARLLKHRKPELLFEALDKLFESGCVSPDDCQVNLVGNIDQRLFKRIGHCKSQSTINLAGHVSRLEAASYQIKSQILLQLAHGDEKGILTGKIFEYLGAGRPILSIPKDHDCVDSLLVTTSAGVSCDTVKEVADFIKKSYDQWRTNGVVSYDGKDVEIRKFHRESQAERIASILDRHSSI